jgi:threonine aldolase
MTAADFRSDTLTRPTPAMRRAMAEAEVGDDVYGEDPTVRALEAELAALFGRAAALFVPTGSMGNQIAVHLQTAPGEEVAVGEASHSYDWEMGALAALSGVQARILATDRGRIDVEAARAALRPAGGFRPACRLLLVENTHNFHGGAVVPLSHLEALHAAARDRGAQVHLDGARLWNAAVASGTALEAYARTADTLMVCLSKGLGAPVGSLLVGDADLIARARDVRKRFGGGMRQVGVLAAPGRVALATMRERLAEDHARARRLAAGLLGNPGVTRPFGEAETNIVLVQVAGRDAAELARRLAARGVRASTAGPDRLRFVTHFDVDDAGVQLAIEAFAAALSA